MIGRRHFGIGGAALALAGLHGGARAQSAKSVLRVVPQAEPQVFDPHQSGVNATQENAALIYDTLFSWDADMVPRPQMVDTWSKSDDGLLYSFTLRPGLKFHDLTPCHVARCRRHAAAAAGARHAEPDPRRPGGGDRREGRTQLHAAAEGAVRLCRFPAVRQQRRDGRHHARAGCADRSVHADQVAHRLRPVPLRRGRIPTRRQAGLREIRRLQSRVRNRPAASPAASGCWSIAWNG